MKPVTRDRLFLPVLLPIAILVVIVAALYGFSRILLSLPPTAATATALAAATGVMVVSAIAASRRQVRLSTTLAMIGATAGVAMLAGGIALAVAPEEEEGEGEGERPVVTLAAFNIAFEPTSLVVPADEAFTLRFNNRDAGVQHNVDIFDNADFSGNALFEGELITGVREIDYSVDPLPAGAYFFRCLVHPNMVGEMEAVPGGEGGGEGGGGVTVVAQDIAFDTSTIELEAGVPATLTFDNRDAGVQHNIAIYTDSSMSEELFNGELITGPATIEYEIPPLDPGEYYFVCIVHPNMNGTVVVSEGGGGEPTGATGEPTGGTGGTGATGGTGPPDGGSAGVAEPATVVAQDLAFDTATITLPAGQASTITLDNRDAGVQHNLMITTDDTLTTQLFNGELITGPATIEYEVPPLEAGEYYFLCLVHPNMNGAVIVR